MGFRSSVRSALTIVDGAIFGGLGDKVPSMPTVTTPAAGSGSWDAALYDRVRPEQIRNLYRLSGWVAQGVSINADAQAMAHFRVNTEAADGTMTPVVGHPFTRLLRRPNPFMTGVEMLRRTASDEMLGGNAYWWLLFMPGFPEPIGVWPLPGQWVKPVTSRDHFIERYDVQPPGGATFPLPPEVVVHFRRYDPDSLTTGIPLLRSIFNTVMGDLAAARYLAQFNAKATRPSIGFSTKEEMDPTEALELKKELMRAYGGPEHAGDIMLTWSGLEPWKVSFTPEEASAIAQRTWNRDEIMAAGFRTSKSMFGLTDDVNRATAEAMEYSFANRNTRPATVFTAAKITADVLIPYYGEDLVAEFHGVVPQDEDRLIAKVGAAVTAHAITRDEVRTELFDGKLGPMPDGAEIAGAPPPVLAPRMAPGPGGPAASRTPAKSMDLEIDGQLRTLVARGATADEIKTFVESAIELDDAASEYLRLTGDAVQEYLRVEAAAEAAG